MQIYTFDFGYAKEALRFLGSLSFIVFVFVRGFCSFFRRKDCMAENCVIQ